MERMDSLGAGCSPPRLQAGAETLTGVLRKKASDSYAVYMRLEKAAGFRNRSDR
jgi:hypothetical protein